MMARDASIGANVVTARARADRTQQEIAAAMRERGFKWSQATVWSTETGARPLRLSEATHLAEVLGCALRDFLWEESSVVQGQSRIASVDEAKVVARRLIVQNAELSRRLGRGTEAPHE